MELLKNILLWIFAIGGSIIIMITLIFAVLSMFLSRMKVKLERLNNIKK